MKKERKNNLKQRIFAMTMAVFTAASPGTSSYLTAYATADAQPAMATAEEELPAVPQPETAASVETPNTEIQPTETELETESETEYRMQSLNVLVNTEGGEVRLNAGTEEEQVVRMMMDEKGTHLNVYDKDGVLLQTVEEEGTACFYPYQTDADSIVSVTAQADEGYTLSYCDVLGEETGFSDAISNQFTCPVWLDEEKWLTVQFQKENPETMTEAELITESQTETEPLTEDGQSFDDLSKEELRLTEAEPSDAPEVITEAELGMETRTETESASEDGQSSDNAPKEELRLTEPETNAEEDIRLTEAAETETMPESESTELSASEQTEGDLRLTEAEEEMPEPNTETEQEDLSVVETAGQEISREPESEFQPDNLPGAMAEEAEEAEDETNRILTFEDDKISVTATLPQGDSTDMELCVKEMERGTKAYNRAYQAVKGTCELKEGQRLVYAPYEISLQENGQPVSLDQPVEATVTYKTQALDEQPEDEDAVFYAAVEGNSAKSVVAGQNDNTVTLALNGSRILGPAAVLDTQPEELSTVTDMSGIKIEVLDGTQAVVASSEIGVASMSKVFDSQEAYTAWVSANPFMVYLSGLTLNLKTVKEDQIYQMQLPPELLPEIAKKEDNTLSEDWTRLVNDGKLDGYGRIKKDGDSYYLQMLFENIIGKKDASFRFQYGVHLNGEIALKEETDTEKGIQAVLAGKALVFQMSKKQTEKENQYQIQLKQEYKKDLLSGNTSDGIQNTLQTRGTGKFNGIVNIDWSDSFHEKAAKQMFYSGSVSKVINTAPAAFTIKANGLDCTTYIANGTMIEPGKYSLNTAIGTIVVTFKNPVTIRDGGKSSYTMDGFSLDFSNAEVDFTAGNLELQYATAPVADSVSGLNNQIHLNQTIQLQNKEQAALYTESITNLVQADKLQVSINAGNAEPITVMQDGAEHSVNRRKVTATIQNAMPYPFVLRMAATNAWAFGSNLTYGKNKELDMNLTDMDGKQYHPTLQYYGQGISYLDYYNPQAFTAQLKQLKDETGKDIDLRQYLCFEYHDTDVHVVALEKNQYGYTLGKTQDDKEMQLHTSKSGPYGTNESEYIILTNKQMKRIDFTANLYEIVNKGESKISSAIFRFTKFGEAETTVYGEAVDDLMSYEYAPVDDGGTKVDVTISGDVLKKILKAPNDAFYFKVTASSDSKNQVPYTGNSIYHQYNDEGIENYVSASLSNLCGTFAITGKYANSGILSVKGVACAANTSGETEFLYDYIGRITDGKYPDCKLSFVTYTSAKTIADIKLEIFGQPSGTSTKYQAQKYSLKIERYTDSSSTLFSKNILDGLHGTIAVSPRVGFAKRADNNSGPTDKYLTTCFVALDKSKVEVTKKDGTKETYNAENYGDTFDSLWKFKSVQVKETGASQGAVFYFDGQETNESYRYEVKPTTYIYQFTPVNVATGQYRQEKQVRGFNNWKVYLTYGNQDANRLSRTRFTGFNHTRDYARGGALSGFEAAITNNSKETTIDYEISFDCNAFLTGLGTKAADIMSVAVNPAASVSMGADSETENVASVKDVTVYYTAPYVEKVSPVKNALLTEQSNKATMIPGTILNGAQDIQEFYLGDGIVKALEKNKFGEEGSEYSKEARDVLAKYFTVKDLRIIQKSRINAQTKAVVLDKGTVNPNCVLTPITEAELTAKNIELPEDAYGLSGNLFLYKLTKADGTAFSTDDTFEVTYDLELDMDAIPDTLQTNLRNADFYQGGSLILTTQAIFAYQGATKMLAAGGWVEDQYLKTPCVKKKQAYSSDVGSKQIASWEIAYDSHTAGKTDTIENVTLRDVMTVDLFDFTDTEKKKAIEQIAFRYLTTENVKYYIADAGNQGTKTELSIGENAGGLTVALDIKEANPSWISSGQTGTTQNTLFEVVMHQVPYQKHITVTYKTVFDWDGFIKEVKESGILTAQELTKLGQIRISNQGECGCQASYEAVSGWWRIPDVLKNEIAEPSLDKVGNWDNTGRYLTYTITYNVGNEDVQDVVITDVLENAVSSAAYGSSAWTQDIQTWALKYEDNDIEKAKQRYWFGEFARYAAVTDAPVTYKVTFTGTLKNVGEQKQTISVTNAKILEATHHLTGDNQRGWYISNPYYQNDPDAIHFQEYGDYGFQLKFANLCANGKIEISYQFDLDKTRFYSIGSYNSGNNITPLSTVFWNSDVLLTANDRYGYLLNTANVTVKGQQILESQKDNSSSYVKVNIPKSNPNQEWPRAEKESFQTLAYTDQKYGNTKELKYWVFFAVDSLGPRYQEDYKIVDTIGTEYAKYIRLGEFYCNNASSVYSSFDGINNNFHKIRSNPQNIKYTENRADISLGNGAQCLLRDKNGQSLRPYLYKREDGFSGFEVQFQPDKLDRSTDILVFAVYYSIYFDYDAFLADGNTEDDFVELTNRLSIPESKFNGTPMKVVETKDKVYNRDILTKTGTNTKTYDANGNAILHWTLDSVLSSKYHDNELTKSFTVTDTLPYGLQYVDGSGKLYWYNPDTKTGEETDENAIAADDYTVAYDGRKISVTMENSIKYQNVRFAFDTIATTSMDEVQNRADIVTNGNKTTVRKQLKKVYTKGQSGSIQSREKLGNLALEKTDAITKLGIPGTVFQLLDKNGTVLLVIQQESGYRLPTQDDLDDGTQTVTTMETSQNGEILIDGIPYGSYSMVETQAAAGYVSDATPIAFTIGDEDFTEQADGSFLPITKTLRKTNTPTRVIVKKTDKVTSKPLPGAVLAIYQGADTETKNGKLQAKENAKAVHRWTTDESGEQEWQTLPIGEYVLVEEAAPYGYELAEPVQFAVVDSGKIVNIAMEDDRAGANMTIAKTVLGDAGADYKKAFQFQLALTGNLAVKAPETIRYTKTDGTKEESGVLTPENGAYAFTLAHGQKIVLENLLPGLAYEVTEKQEREYVPGIVNGTGAIADKTPISVTVTNMYRPTRTLTVTKTVTGNQGDKTKQFTFVLQMEKDSLPDTVHYTKGEKTGTLAVQNGKVVFTLGHGETIVFDDIPVDTKYQITEPDAAKEGYTVRSSKEQGTLSEDTIAAFTNERNVGIPTAANTNTNALLIVLLGAAAGVVLIATKKKK